MPDPLGNPEVSARPEGHIARLEILSAVHRSRWLRASNSGAASKSSSSIGKLGHPRNVFFTSIPTFWGIWGSGRISFRRVCSNGGCASSHPLSANSRFCQRPTPTPTPPPGHVPFPAWRPVAVPDGPPAH